MILVPSETVARLQEKTVIPTPSTKINQLDSEMDAVLQQPGNAEDKIKRYEQLLQKCMHFINEQRKPFRLTIPSAPDEPQTKALKEELIDIIVSQLECSVPPKLKNASKVIHDVLEKTPHFSWDSNGQVTIDGRPFPRSNIVDFIADAVKQRRKGHAEGWEEMCRALAKTNFPFDLIRNSAYKRIIREQRGSGLTPRDVWKRSIIKRAKSAKKCVKPSSWKSWK